MANLKYIGKNILNHDLILKKGNVSGSASSTGSFGNLNISSDASVTGNMVVGGRLTAQEIHTEIESASIIFTSGSTKFGDTSDDTHEFTGSILVKGNLTAENLTADSSSFSTRTTTLEAASASFSTRITTAETELELTLISGSAQIATQISGAFDTVSSSLSSRLQTAETELENTLISGSAQLANQISGAFTSGFEFDGTISGSATSTASFGNLTVDGNSTVDGDLIVSQYIRHKGDTNTLINFTDNHIRFNVGGINFASLEKDASAPYPLTINNGGNRVNFRVVDQNTDLLLKTDSDANNVKLYHAGNQKLETKSTGVDVTGSLDITGSLTTIGNISGSATSTGSFGKILGDGSDIGNLPVSAINNATENRLVTIGATTSELDAESTLTFNGTQLDLSSAGHATVHITGASGKDANLKLQNNSRLWIFQNDGDNTLFGGSGALHLFDGTAAASRIIVDSTGVIQTPMGVSGSATSTGSFGLVLQNGSELSTFLGAAGTETLFSGSAASTGSFGRVDANSGSFGRLETADDMTVGDDLTVNGNISGPTTSTIDFGPAEFHSSGDALTLRSLGSSGGSNTVFLNFTTNNNPAASRNVFLKASQNSGNLGMLTIGTYGTADGSSGYKDILQIGAQGSQVISGSATSTGSFGRLETAGVIIDNNNVSATSFTGIFQGALSGSAQIASNISGAFAVASASFAADILTNSSSFAARDTLSEATSSKILNGELEFTNITGSGHISMSLSSTGSFGRVSLTTLGGHSPFVIDSIVTASSAVQLDGKVFIQTGSIEGDLHVRTNENLMRIGKSTSGLIVSGSEEISRFATGSDGSIIDLGFTITDEDGNVVLAGDGDGIHIDGNNYWYNNKYYKVGDGVNNFLKYDTQDGIRYKGEVTVQTGSFGGEMFINSPTGSMFIGKYTGGIPSSGSDNVSRFATGSDGSIIDLGFTTTDESGETVFLTTGDGIVRDDQNYWYTTGHFKVGNGEKQIEWNTTDLNISASTVDVTTLKASDVNFAGLPTSDPLVTGSLWISGSATSGSYKSGFVMISGIHG